MSEELHVVAPPWAAPWVKVVCKSCQREYTKYKDDDGNPVTFAMVGYVKFPPDECPKCGNRGQNLTWCRSCNRLYPEDAALEHGDDAGYCPACCGEEENAGPFHWKGHDFEDDGEGRCKVCTEAERHWVHDPLEEDEEDG